MRILGSNRRTHSGPLYVVSSTPARIAGEMILTPLADIAESGGRGSRVRLIAATNGSLATLLFGRAGAPTMPMDVPGAPVLRIGAAASPSVAAASSSRRDRRPIRNHAATIAPIPKIMAARKPTTEGPSREPAPLDASDPGPSRLAGGVGEAPAPPAETVRLDAGAPDAEPLVPVVAAGVPAVGAATGPVDVPDAGVARRGIGVGAVVGATIAVGAAVGASTAVGAAVGAGVGVAFFCWPGLSDGAGVGPDGMPVGPGLAPRTAPADARSTAATSAATALRTRIRFTDRSRAGLWPIDIIPRSPF